MLVFHKFLSAFYPLQITAPISIRRSDTIGGKSDTIGGSGMHTNYKPELVVKYSRCELRELGTSRTTEKIEGKMVYTRKRKELVKEHKEQATMPEGDDDANDDGGHVMQDEKTDFRYGEREIVAIVVVSHNHD